MFSNKLVTSQIHENVKRGEQHQSLRDSHKDKISLHPDTTNLNRPSTCFPTNSKLQKFITDTRKRQNIRLYDIRKTYDLIYDFFLKSCSLLDRHYCLLLIRNNSVHFLQTLLPSWHTCATSHHVPTAGSTPLLGASNPHSPHPLGIPCSNHTTHNWPNWRKSTFK